MAAGTWLTAALLSASAPAQPALGEANARVFVAQASLVQGLAEHQHESARTVLAAWLEQVRDATRSVAPELPDAVRGELRQQAKNVAQCLERLGSPGDQLGRAWRDLADALERLGEEKPVVQRWRRRSLEKRPVSETAHRILLQDLSLAEPGEIDPHDRALAQALLEPHAHDDAVSLTQQRRQLLSSVIQRVRASVPTDPANVQGRLDRWIAMLLPDRDDCHPDGLVAVTVAGLTPATGLAPVVRLCVAKGGPAPTPMRGQGPLRFLALPGQTYALRFGTEARTSDVVVHFGAAPDATPLSVDVADVRDDEVLALELAKPRPEYWVVKRAPRQRELLVQNIRREGPNIELHDLLRGAAGVELQGTEGKLFVAWSERATSSHLRWLPTKDIALWLQPLVGREPFETITVADAGNLRLLHQDAEDVEFQSGATWLVLNAKQR